MVNKNFTLRRTTVPVTVAILLLAFGWFYYFIDIGSLLDRISDLVNNSVEANIDGSRIHANGGPSTAIGKDGEDGKVGISIGDGQGTAIADGGNGGNGGTAITSGSTGSTANANGGNGGNGGIAINSNSPGATASANGGNGGNGGVVINVPS